MSSDICSKNFKAFYENIERIGLSPDEIAQRVKESLPLIAEDIYLGRMECRFYAPPTPFEKYGREAEMVLYEHESGYSDELFSREYSTSNGASVGFKVNAVRGHRWSEKEREDVEFVCKNIFAMCGRARLAEVINKSLSVDFNTGLLSLSGFMSIGATLLNQDRLQDYTAMYINIKNFKYINGKIGNKNGDIVIKEYAIALGGMLLDDEYAARLGGDNFTLLIKKGRRDIIAEGLSCISINTNYGGMEHHLNISARIGMYDIMQGDEMPHVMNCISAAIAMAKRRNAEDIVLFSQAIVSRMAREQAIATDFPFAVKEREFVVYYQPKVDVRNHEICGCEALVRWLKNGKLVPPLEFIPLFERDGSICTLDFYVLDQVCRDIKKWTDMGVEPVTVSVNFSKMHLQNPDIAQQILDVVDKYGIEHRYIEIELTEMSDYSDYDAVKKLVNAMKENNIVTSIDDFGTGYSSLNLLTDFMFDVVKLDKSFIDNVIKNGSKTDEIVVRNMVKMLRELDMKTVAEGVETPDQARFLNSIDCSVVQGYLYDKPLCEEEFFERLKARRYSGKIEV